MKRKIFLKKKITIYDSNKLYNKIRYKFKFLKLVNENILLGLILFEKNYFLKNFYFYTYFMNFLKNKNFLYYLNNNIRFFDKILFLTPSFLFKKQLFSYNIFFLNYCFSNNIKNFFLFKNFIKNYFFIKNNKNIKINFSSSHLVFNTNEDLINNINDVELKKFYFFVKNKYEKKKIDKTPIKSLNLKKLLNLEIYKFLNLIIFLNCTKNYK